MGQSLAGMKAPFFLLNNYPITHETYRDVRRAFCCAFVTPGFWVIITRFTYCFFWVFCLFSRLPETLQPTFY